MGKQNAVYFEGQKYPSLSQICVAQKDDNANLRARFGVPSQLSLQESNSLGLERMCDCLENINFLIPPFLIARCTSKVKARDIG